MTTGPRRYWNAYVAGAGLGLVLTASYLILGTGLGASGGIARLAAAGTAEVAPGVASNAYLAPWFAGAGPLHSYLVFMLAGTLLGGFFSALAADRIVPGVERGPRATVGLRLLLALGGGVLAGLGARMAGGCTSGLALSGGAMLQTGALLFTAATFAAAFAVAPLVRKEWR